MAPRKAKSTHLSTPSLHANIILGTESDELALSSPPNHEIDTPLFDDSLSLRPLPTVESFPSMPNKDELEPDKTTDANERLIWSLEMVEQLLEVLYEVFQAGGAADNSFKKTTFELAASKVRGVYKGPLDITQEKCKNKWADIKKKWGHWVCLSEQSGFGFNSETKLYEAYDYVWDNLNKSKPTIIWHKTYILHHRDLIGEILHKA